MSLNGNVVGLCKPDEIDDPRTKAMQFRTVSFRCASLLRKHHASLVKALIAGINRPRENRFEDPPKAFEERVGESLNLLIRHVEGMPDFGELFAGQRLFELYRKEWSREDNLRFSRQSVEEDGIILRAYLARLVSAEELGAFEGAYQSATADL